MPEHHVMPGKPSNSEVTSDLLSRYEHPGGPYWLAVIVFAVLFLAGIVGFIIRISEGFPNTPAWGYYAAIFAFLLTTVMSAPIVAAGLYFTKAVWPRRISRAAMLWSVPGFFWALMFLPLLAALPPLQGRATIWFDAPRSVVLWADTIAVFALALVGIAIMYFRSRPDWAAIRDHRGVGHAGWAGWLAAGWRGSIRDWTLLHGTITLLGAAYLFLYAYVTMLVTTDFDMSLLPGWRSAIYPTYHIVTSLQGALAFMLVTVALLRRFGHLEQYFQLDQFWAMGKMLLAFSLLWFYFFWSEFIVIWYGRTPREQTLLQTLDFGPYFVPFALTAILCLVVPFLLLIWNPIRKSFVGPPLAAVSVLIGLFFDRLRLYVPAFATAGQGGAAAGQVAPIHLPDVADVLIIVGALAAVVLFYLLSMRLLPVISIWEAKVYLMFRETRRFLHTIVEVVGKPD